MALDITLEISIKLFCECGQLLEIAKYDSRRKEAAIKPCPVCLKAAENKGIDEGYERGLESLQETKHNADKGE